MVPVAADARGGAIPPEHLPALADYARGRAEYRPLVVNAAGRRASLAGRSESGVAVPSRSRCRRQRSDLDARERDPAPELVASAVARAIRPRRWRRCERSGRPRPQPTRLDFLGAAAPTACRAADEEFLEQALDDRAKEVRRLAAAGLLARIAGSQYGARMAQRVLVASDRVSQGVSPSTSRAGRPRRWNATVSSRKPQEGIGKRAWWFRQLVAAAPLSTYELSYLQLSSRRLCARGAPGGLGRGRSPGRTADWARASC